MCNFREEEDGEGGNVQTVGYSGKKDKIVLRQTHIERRKENNKKKDKRANGNMWDAHFESENP